MWFMILGRSAFSVRFLVDQCSETAEGENPVALPDALDLLVICMEAGLGMTSIDPNRRDCVSLTRT